MTDSHKLSFSTGTGFLLTTGLAVAYWVGLNEMEPGSCRGPPLFWAIFSKYYLLISAITLLLIIMLNHVWKYEYSSFKKTIIWLLFLPNLGTAVYVVGNFIAFHYRQECPGLHDLIVVAFWIAILICFSPLIACFLLCISGGVEAVKQCLFGTSSTHYRSLHGVPDVHITE